MKNIAKTPHRIFELYDDRDEAIQALTPKVATPLDQIAWDSSTYRQLSVSPLGCIVHVEFARSQRYEAENLGELGDDFLQLSQELPMNSKVLIDFQDVEVFCPSSIELIVEFNKRLRNKGSRVVLCCIASEVLKNFFPK